MEPPLFPGCDVIRPPDSNDVSILESNPPQYIENRNYQAIVGEPCVELEEALTSIMAAENELNTPDKENRDGFAESKLELKIHTIPSLDPAVFNWHDCEPGPRIDYILILINPITTADCLLGVEKMLEHIDPVFYARKRVNFCYVKRNMDISLVSALASKTFCTKYKTSFQTIRVDDSDSVDLQARLCYNKAQRIIRNPLVF